MQSNSSCTDQGAQGTLYRCSGTNTWTVHYTPYAYPHPLVIGSVAAHDFDGDGKSDIAWRDTSGNTAVWLMNGPTAKATAVIGTTSLSWVIINTGDFNGDGKSDILWQLTNTSRYGVWFMNGTTISSTFVYGNVGSTWNVQAMNSD